MVGSDPLGDMLTRIRNGQRAQKSSILVPSSKLRANVLEVLKREGYIRGYQVVDAQAQKTANGYSDIRVDLKYHEGSPAIKEIARVSKPGRRVYSKIKELPKYYNGLGVMILSTPRGVMADHEARVAKVGGEVLCRVF